MEILQGKSSNWAIWIVNRRIYSYVALLFFDLVQNNYPFETQNCTKWFVERGASPLVCRGQLQEKPTEAAIRTAAVSESRCALWLPCATWRLVMAGSESDRPQRVGVGAGAKGGPLSKCQGYLWMKDGVKGCRGRHDSHVSDQQRTSRLVQI